MEIVAQEKEQVSNQPPKIPKKLVILGAAAVLVVVAVMILAIGLSGPKKAQAEVVTISTLEKIINVSDLSTFTAVYNGVAKVMDEKKTDKVQYYVSYNAKVNAGIDFEQIRIELDEDSKTIYVKIPDVKITDVNVDITSLDFIFNDKKADQSTVSEEAYKACRTDVEQESSTQSAIFELAKQNAQNVLRALIEPVISQLDGEYTLSVE